MRIVPHLDPLSWYEVERRFDLDILYIRHKKLNLKWEISRLEIEDLGRLEYFNHFLLKKVFTPIRVRWTGR